MVVLTNSPASNDVTIANTGYKKFRRQLIGAGVELYEYRADPKDRVDSETPPITEAPHPPQETHRLRPAEDLNRITECRPEIDLT